MSPLTSRVCMPSGLSGCVRSACPAQLLRKCRWFSIAFAKFSVAKLWRNHFPRKQMQSTRSRPNALILQVTPSTCPVGKAGGYERRPTGLWPFRHLPGAFDSPTKWCLAACAVQPFFQGTAHCQERRLFRRWMASLARLIAFFQRYG